jgi:hypothetical protein
MDCDDSLTGKQRAVINNNRLSTDRKHQGKAKEVNCANRL